MEDRLKYKKKQFDAAVSDFSTSLNIDISKLDSAVGDSVRSGRAQKFEFCTELLWKTVKVFLNEIHGIDENSPKTVIKSLFTLEYITAPEYEIFIEMLNDRNMLSHLYKKEQFDEIYKRLIKTLPLYKKILEII